MSSGLSHSDITTMFLALGTLLGSARVLGELARRFNQPAVLGEIIAGILLGPTVLGRVVPDIPATLFAKTGPVATFMQGFGTVAVALFLLVAGLEVDLGRVWRQGRSAITVSLSGIVVPFAIGILCGWFAPTAMGREPGADPLIFALFFATALAISALPVIAKTLMDLGLFRTDLGMIVIASAIFEDLVGWIIFATILSMMGSGAHSLPVGYTVLLTLSFAAAMLTVARRFLNWVLPWIQAFLSWPGGVLGFVATIALFCAAFTEWIGVHAIFGTFMAGVALGDSPHLRERTRATLEQFVAFIFAPIFFAGIGTRVDFVANFDGMLVVTVLAVACIGKIVGCGLGARWSGNSRRESAAIGLAMNARGAMEIILGLLALQHGVIRERMFVALVVMALVTSIMSGPLIQKVLRRKRARHLADHLARVEVVDALDPAEAIRSLSRSLATHAGLSPELVENAVLERERMMPTGLEGGVAVPHAPIPGLATPFIAVGIAKHGVDFGAVDGQPSRLLFLVLTPAEDPEAQLEILADIAKTFSQQGISEKALEIRSLTEFLALTRADAGMTREAV
jgi:K+:H+ antiporter